MTVQVGAVLEFLVIGRAGSFPGAAETTRAAHPRRTLSRAPHERNIFELPPRLRVVRIVEGLRLADRSREQHDRAVDRAHDAIDADLIVAAERAAWGVALAGTGLVDWAVVAVKVAALRRGAS